MGFEILTRSGLARPVGVPARCALLGLFCLAFLAAPLSAEAQGVDGGGSAHVIPLFRAAGQAQQGFVRIINHSDRSGTVRIWGTDDTGERRGPVTLSLNARSARQFNSDDLEEGEAGLVAGLGEGVGD